jgi:hypothetical protein
MFSSCKFITKWTRMDVYHHYCHGRAIILLKLASNTNQLINRCLSPLTPRYSWNNAKVGINNESSWISLFLVSGSVSGWVVFLLVGCLYGCFCNIGFPTKLLLKSFLSQWCNYNVVIDNKDRKLCTQFTNSPTEQVY